VEALWASLQEGLARLSPTSALILATTSHHRIHQTQPELVADAIHAIVDPSRWPPAGPAASPQAFGSGAPSASLDPAGGLVAYGAGDGIHLARVDGSGDRIVVPADGYLAGQPTLDAAGTRLAYTRSPAPRPSASGPTGDVAAELWLVDLGSGERRRLADDAILPAISPDGSEVAFSHHGHAYLVAAAGGAAPRDLGEGGCTVWSPDGARLAMCTPDDAIFVLDPATGARMDIDAGAGPNQPGAWSPDGSRLAITSTRGGDADVYVVGLDGSPARRLAGGPGNQAADAWLPAGILATGSLPEDEVSAWFLLDPASGLPEEVDWLHGRANPIAWSPGGG
jgi:hypothetical protein